MPKATSTPRHARRGDDLSQWREAARHPLFTASFVERPGFTKHDFEEALAAKLKKVCASPEVARDALHSLSPGGPHSEPVIGLPAGARSYGVKNYPNLGCTVKFEQFDITTTPLTFVDADRDPIARNDLQMVQMTLLFNRPINGLCPVDVTLHDLPAIPAHWHIPVGALREVDDHLEAFSVVKERHSTAYVYGVSPGNLLRVRDTATGAVVSFEVPRYVDRRRAR